MKRIHAASWWVCLLVLPLLAGGCKKPKANTEEDPSPKTTHQGGGPGVGSVFPAVGRTVTSVELQQFWFFYDQMCESGSPPKKLTDMTTLRTQGQKIYQAIEEGDIVVCWGANTKALGGNPGSTILAYGKEVPEKPGAAVMVSGQIVARMTPEEFKATPKAGKP